MPKHGSMSLYVHTNRKAHSDEKPRMATSTFTQLLNSTRVIISPSVQPHATQTLTFRSFGLFVCDTQKHHQYQNSELCPTVPFSGDLAYLNTSCCKEEEEEEEKKEKNLICTAV